MPQLTPISLAGRRVEISALYPPPIYYRPEHPTGDPFTTAARLHSIPVKFGCMEWFILVMVFFDHSSYKKSPVHNTNLHQNIFTRKWSQNEFGDTMKRKQPSGSKRLLYKSDISYSGAGG